MTNAKSIVFVFISFWKTADAMQLPVGVENIFSYVQENPIIDAENPFSENFDASLIYGPVMGRLFYLGLRYSFK